MPFIVCPRCQQATDFAEPVGDFSTTHLLCEKCAEEFAKEIREKAIRDARDLGKLLLGMVML